MLALYNISAGTLLHDCALELAPSEAVYIDDASPEEMELLIPILLGDTKPDAGIVSVDGVNLASLTPKFLSLYRRNTFLLTRKPLIVPEWNVREHVEHALRARGEKDRVRIAKRASQALTGCGLAEEADLPTNQLTGHMQHMLMLACAMVCDPKILIVCDLFAGPQEATLQAFDILEHLHAAGASVLLFTHHPDLPEQANWRRVSLHEEVRPQKEKTNSSRRTRREVATLTA